MSSQYPLNYLYLYLTDSCNLKCRHCWISPADTDSHHQVLPTRIAEVAIESSLPLGLKEVKLTGGEPTLAPDFESIAAAIGARGIRINVETNATLLRDSAIQLLAQYGGNVSVSLDSNVPTFHNWLRGRDWAFTRAVDGIRRLVGNGIAVNAIMSVCSLNLRHVEGTLSLCRDLGIRSLKVNPIIPLGRASGEMRPYLLDCDGIRTLINEVNRLSVNSGVSITVDVPYSLQPLDSLISGSGNCHFLNILSILPNGDISFCGFGSSEQSRVIGNAGRDRIESIWDANEMVKHLRDGLPSKLTGVCSACLFKTKCRGGCRALAFADSKNFFGPHPICAMFLQQGKFPISRLLSQQP